MWRMSNTKAVIFTRVERLSRHEVRWIAYHRGCADRRVVLEAAHENHRR
jgi:hypothetical protein